MAKASSRMRAVLPEVPLVSREPKPELPGIPFAAEVLTSPAKVFIYEHLRYAKELALDLSNPEVVRRCIDTATRKWRAHEDESAQVPLGRESRDLEAQGVVYYMRVDTMVKIGTTRSLRHRLDAVNPQELMGVEVGSYDVEGMRHREFTEFHVYSEWFRLGPVLRRHISSLPSLFREKSGLEMWPWIDRTTEGSAMSRRSPNLTVVDHGVNMESVVVLPKSPEKPVIPSESGLSVSPETSMIDHSALVTAKEAAAVLGVTVNVIGMWKLRGWINPATQVRHSLTVQGYRGRAPLFKWGDLLLAERDTFRSPQGRRKRTHPAGRNR